MNKQSISFAVLAIAGSSLFQACENSPSSVPEQAPIAQLSSAVEMSSADAWSIPAGVSSMDAVPLSSMHVVPMSSEAVAYSSMDVWPSSSAGWFPVSSSVLIIPTSSAVIIPGSSSVVVVLVSSSAILPSSASGPSTGGKLLVTFTPSGNGGQYCPKNVNATWLTDGSGKWVGNLEMWGQTRSGYLYKWKADYGKSPVKGIDGVAGATQGSFMAKNLNYNLASLAQGNYTLKLENTCANKQGPFQTVNFVWNGSAIDTLVNFTYHKNVRLLYTP